MTLVLTLIKNYAIFGIIFFVFFILIIFCMLVYLKKNSILDYVKKNKILLIIIVILILIILVLLGFLNTTIPVVEYVLPVQPETLTSNKIISNKYNLNYKLYQYTGLPQNNYYLKVNLSR